MKKTLLFLVLSLCCFGVSKAQQINNKSNQIAIEEKLKKYEGTYQIQVVNSRQKPSIPYNLDEIIEKNRDKNKVVFVQLGTLVRLKILSEDEIKKVNFKKLEQVVNIIE